MRRTAFLFAALIVVASTASVQAGPIRNWIKQHRPGVLIQKPAAASYTATGCR